MERRYKIFLLVMLGMFAAFASLINNTLGPVLKLVADTFQASDAVVGLGLTASMAGLAAGQIIIGPLSDKYGRRTPVILSVGLFALSSLAIVFSPSITIFIVLRFVQGLGGAGGIVISRSIATDNFKGRDLMTSFAIVNVINGIAPIVAPAASGAMASMGGWQAVFVMLAVVGFVLLLGSYRLRESLPNGHRTTGTLLSTFKLYGTVVRNKRFMFYVLHQCTAEVVLFGNIASVAAIVNHYGYHGAMAASITLSVNGIFTALGAGLAARFKQATSGVKACCVGIITLAVVEAAVLYMGWSFWAYEALVCAMLVCVGITLTASTTLALESEREQAGTASALFGAMGFIAGAVVAPLVALGNPLHSTAIVYVAGAAVSCAFAYLALRLK